MSGVVRAADARVGLTYDAGDASGCEDNATAVLRGFESRGRKTQMTRGKWARAPSRRFALASLLSIGALASASADPYSQFSFCAPPAKPECVDRPPAGADRCVDDIAVYVAGVFKYRECLEREMERAVREANDVIESSHCRASRTRCRPNAQPDRGRPFLR